MEASRAEALLGAFLIRLLSQWVPNQIEPSQILTQTLS
jgi:hypothetical protein